MVIDKKTRITLYHTGCDCRNEFATLHQFIVQRGVPLDNYIAKRIELNRDWQEERLNYDLKLPFVVFEREDEKLAMTYKELMEVI